MNRILLVTTTFPAFFQTVFFEISICRTGLTPHAAVSQVLYPKPILPLIPTIAFPLLHCMIKDIPYPTYPDNHDIHLQTHYCLQMLQL